MYILKIEPLLKEKGKTKYWLSKQTGISSNNIGYICNGKSTNITLNTVYKICKALDCTPNDIICEEKGDTE